MFGDRIDYAAVHIVDGRFLPWQLFGYVIAPGNEIYWPGACADVAHCPHEKCRDTLIHELTHVMQHQHGVNVLWRGGILQTLRFCSLKYYDPYQCAYESDKAFSAYNIEQQAVLAVEIYRRRIPNGIDYEVTRA